MYKKNKLKDLIYIQENKPCNEQTVDGLFRSIVEPILEQNAESLVLCRLEENSKLKFNGILKRLEYSNAKVYDFSDSPLGDKFENVLKEKIWENTEFVYVLAQRFGAVLIFDYAESDIENFAQIYLLHNSKNLSDSFDIINSNSLVDLGAYQEKNHPDRRDNDMLNLSIKKIVENLNERNQEILVSEMEKSATENDSDYEARFNFMVAKSSYMAHEMRNLLSICNLYSTIIEKQSSFVKFETEESAKSIHNARNCIRKTLQMTGNLLLGFKSLNTTDLKEYDLKDLINSGLELSKIYATGREINFTYENAQSVTVLADENRFLAVLINLIKNAIESIQDKGDIIIKTEILADNVNVIISNTGNSISKELQNKIFEEGFTTKTTGSGLGLVICKQTLEEQFAQLKLRKSDEVSTEFEITLLRG